jgi:hypothetical protein
MKYFDKNIFIKYLREDTDIIGTEVFQKCQSSLDQVFELLKWDTIGCFKRRSSY